MSPLGRILEGVLWINNQEAHSWVSVTTFIMIETTCKSIYNPKKEVINMATVFKVGLSTQQSVIMSHKGVHVLIPRTYAYVTLHCKDDLLDLIRLRLRRGDYTGRSEWEK